MEDKKVILTPTDMKAINLSDSNYLNNKGAKYYSSENYDEAVEYYRIAATMGNVLAISNLGYCYLYGRKIEKNLSLAIAYFKIAAMKNDVDAMYKLGDIYGSDKWGVKDQEMSAYYYRNAASLVIHADLESNKTLYWCTELHKYPSLCFALGRELSKDGDMPTDLELAYQFLKHAEIGYKRDILNFNNMYKQSYESVLKLLADSQFDEIREIYDDRFNDDYYNDEE